MAEQVYMVWDYYDGVRSGIADYFGKPYYFEPSLNFDEDDEIPEYALKPIDDETLAIAQEQWTIYRDWEIRFHSGKEDTDSHPARGGPETHYAKLQAKLDAALEAESATVAVGGRFKAKAEQPELPYGCLREMEVEWL